MSVPLEGQRGGREDVSLRAHACPPADPLPQLNPNARILPPGSLVPAEKSSEVTCGSEAEVEYLNVFSRNTEEEDEGSTSEWSEEDLSLYFSPSVILQSDNEESESGLEGVDVTIATQVEGEKRPKEVAKQQVLLWGKDKQSLIGQVMMKDELSEMGGFTKGHYCQHSFLRQHSMPASLNMHPTPSGEADSYRVYKGQTAGTEPPTEGNWRCLKKSNSLDETKTKMASSLIRNILSKKMQVERRDDSSNTVKKKLETLPVAAPPTEQQGNKKVEETGVFKAPVHLVRDGRSYSKYANMKTSSCDAIGQKESISHLSAVKGKQPVAMVTASFNESENRKQDFSGRRLTTNEPIPDRDKGGGANNDASGFSQSQTAGVSPPPLLKQMHCSPEPHQLRPCSYGSAQNQRNPPQFGPIQHPHRNQLPPALSGVQFPPPGLSGVPSSLQHTSPPPTRHLSSNSVKNQSHARGNSSHVLDGTETKGDQDCRSFGRTESKPFPWSLQPVVPAQVGSHFVFTAAAGAFFSIPSPSPRCLSMNTPPAAQRKMLVDPETGQFVQVFLPAHPAMSTSSTPVSALSYGSPAPSMLHVWRYNPTVLPLVHFPPMNGVPFLYGAPCLPVTMTTSQLHTCDDVIPHAPR